MIDILIDRIDELNNPTVVGLDPTIEMIPGYLKEAKFSEFGKTPQAVAEMFVEFNRQIMLRMKQQRPGTKTCLSGRASKKTKRRRVLRMMTGRRTIMIFWCTNCFTAGQSEFRSSDRTMPSSQTDMTAPGTCSI